jgi:hypothetical protein
MDEKLLLRDVILALKKVTNCGSYEEKICAAKLILEYLEIYNNTL